MSKGGDKRPIVIRRKKVVHAHHGGSVENRAGGFHDRTNGPLLGDVDFECL